MEAMNKYKKILLHIPHSSLYIPQDGLKEYSNYKELFETIEKLTDWYTDKLFFFNKTKLDIPIFESFIFKYSRAYCDVERYFIDEHEVMAERGMGYTYTHGVNLLPFRNKKEIDEFKINQIHVGHHNNIEKRIKELNSFNIKPLLIDCHSFSDEIYKCDEDIKFRSCLPDICLGYNSNDINSAKIIKEIKEQLINKEYSVEINYPYTGSLTVNNVEHDSIMIEVNKKLYLNNNYTYNSNLYKIREDLYNILISFI